MPTMRCLLIVRHGRPGGAEQPVLAPSLLRCNSFAFRARSGRAHLYNPNHDRRRPTARRQTSLDVEGPGRGRRVSRVIDRCPDGHTCILAVFPRAQAAQPPGSQASQHDRIRTAPRIRSAGLADGRRTASRPPDGPAGVGRQVRREPLDALRKVGPAVPARRISTESCPPRPAGPRAPRFDLRTGLTCVPVPLQVLPRDQSSHRQLGAAEHEKLGGTLGHSGDPQCHELGRAGPARTGLPPVRRRSDGTLSSCARAGSRPRLDGGRR
jgi:hypothetical protein